MASCYPLTGGGPRIGRADSRVSESRGNIGHPQLVFKANGLTTVLNERCRALRLKRARRVDNY